MSNPGHVAKIEEGVDAWNQWREENPDIIPDLSEANLFRANLFQATLLRATLSGADLRRANLFRANLFRANLSEANLFRAVLDGANLNEANLFEADLAKAVLTEADLNEADLTEANLRKADLTEATLRGANLDGANLSGANLSEANLSGCTGLLNPAEWMRENFKQTETGFIVYRALNKSFHSAPSTWKYESGAAIEEVVNSNRCNHCGCGVNFATKRWIKCIWREPDLRIGKFLLEYVDLANLIVPYNTDGKARCARLIYLGEEISYN